MVDVNRCLQRSAVYMGVNLGRGYVSMPQHVLDRPQISTSLQEMRRKGVAELVRRDTLRNPCYCCVTSNYFKECHAAESFRAVAYKNEIARNAFH